MDRLMKRSHPAKRGRQSQGPAALVGRAQGTFLRQYAEYVQNVLAPTNNELKEVFQGWRDPAHWSLEPALSRVPAPSPVQRAISRIKRPESAVDKILRNHELFPAGLTKESVVKMHDAVGGRIIVYFLSNLPLIDRELRTSHAFEISSLHPPVAYLTHELTERLGLKHMDRQSKESGYALIHYVVRLRSSAVPMAQRPWFELQVRTLAEDVWGEIEHILGYKPNKKTLFAVRKQFQIISAELTAIDEHFNLLYEELSRFQRESSFEDNSLLNAENLAAVLWERKIRCAQREIDGLLKLLASRSVKTVGDLRLVATSRNIEAVRKVYRETQRRSPTNFEIVASLAVLKGLMADTEVIDAVKSHVKFLQAWEKLRDSFDTRRLASKR